MGAPILIGSAIGGLTNRKNPLQGALLGAALGGAGNAFIGSGGLSSLFGSFADDAAASALTGSGASTVQNTMFANAAGVNPTTVIGASQAAAPSTFMGASQAPGIFAPPSGGYQSLTAGMQQPLTYEQATATGMQRPIGFLESTFNPNIESSSMAPSFMEQIGSGASQVGQYAQQNSVLTNQALGYAQQAMQQPPEQPLAPGQINRGQIQPMDYMSLLNPQQSTVLRPQPISLLG